MPSIDLRKYQRLNAKKPDVKKFTTAEFSFTRLMETDISFGSRELADKKKEFLYLELSSLLKAGIDFRNAFALIADDQQGDKDKTLFSDIQKDVLQGTAFSAALERTGRFSIYEIFSLQIGEETGKQVEVLQDLAAFYKNRIKQRRTIVSSLTYPVIVLSTSLGAVFFMLKFVVPMFGDVFKRFGGQLPWITAKIIGISAALERNFWPAVLIILLSAALMIYYRKTQKFRAISAALILRMPLVGNLVQKIYLARFCNSMRLLINAKLPLLRAIALSRQMVNYYPLEATLLQVEQEVLNGTSLHESLQKFSIYPPKMIQLLKVGEETNQLDYFFAWVSDQYIAEVEHKTATLSTAMQPLIILFLGLIVGLILISMYLPLFQMSNSFQ